MVTDAAAAEWGDWRDYLANEMTPVYARAELTSVRVNGSSHWTTQAGMALLPDFAADLLGDEPAAGTRLTISRERNSSSLLQSYGEGRGAGNALLRDRVLQREYFAPGVVQQLNDDTALNVAVVLARQQYGAANLGYETSGMLDSERFISGALHTPYQETVHGTGVRFGLESQLFSSVGLTAGYQSRIDMEGFSSFRGVYADPADLDIPARFGLGLNFSFLDRFQLVAETERIDYSEINAFPSTLLPQRFLSLLGDSTSPEFAWSNLTVYRFSWNWQINEDVSMNFTYATRSQPLPTSDVLADALREDLARNSFSVGVSSRTGRFGDFSLNAAYAPAEYAFGGNVLGIVTSDLDKSLEVEMLWRLRY